MLTDNEFRKPEDWNVPKGGASALLFGKKPDQSFFCLGNIGWLFLSSFLFPNKKVRTIRKNGIWFLRREGTSPFCCFDLHIYLEKLQKQREAWIWKRYKNSERSLQRMQEQRVEGSLTEMQLWEGSLRERFFRYPQPCSSATWGCFLKMGRELSSSLDLAVPRGNVRVQKLWLGPGAYGTDVSCEGSYSLPHFLLQC